MHLPFSTEAFLRVFEQYNLAVWPMQLLLVLLALVAVGLGWKAQGGRSRAVTLILGLLWIWMGVVYQWGFFTRINPAAWLFGALFTLQGLLFLYEGNLKKRITVGRASSGARWLSVALLAYALVVYPILGHLLGHAYPRSPTFGLPCPTTIFTFGLLLLAQGPAIKRLLVIPFLWSVVGFSAALQFGIHEDVGLLVAALLATPVVIARDLQRRRLRGEATAATPTAQP